MTFVTVAENTNTYQKAKTFSVPTATIASESISINILNMKGSYAEATQKQRVRSFLFKFLKKRKLVGLAGPDINEYLDWAISNGLHVSSIWERNYDVFYKQLVELRKDIPVNINLGDVYEAVLENNTIYDLDFCGNVCTLIKHIKKFSDTPSVMTFSLRPVGFEDSLKLFFKTKGEKVIQSVEWLSPIPHVLIDTDKATYIAAKYFDTAPMMSIVRKSSSIL